MTEAYLLSVVRLDDTDTPLYRQIYEGVREGILTQQLRPGCRLPSIRDAAQLLQVSRNTVVSAYDQLLSEGYLESRRGAGTFVSQQLPEELLEAHFALPQYAESSQQKRQLSHRSQMIQPLPPTSVLSPEPLTAFRYGLPALDHFPWDIWARLTSHLYRYPQYASFDYAQMSAGYQPLREALATYLSTARALRCDPEQVILTTGAQQGIYLAAHILADPGDSVWMEEPGYQGARRAFQNAGLHLVPVTVDERGLDVAEGEARAPQARLAFITPSRHHPTGTTLSLERRLQLQDWAQRHGSWIIEDDYDSEFRYDERPLPALQGQDATQRVIYVGTLSKVLFPALRLGYVVVPHDLIEAFVNLRGIIDTYTPTITQRVLATFMEQGHFVRHIRKMRQLYKHRRDVFLGYARELDSWLTFTHTKAGMSLTAWLPEGMNDIALCQQAATQGLVLSPVSPCYLEQTPRHGLVFGFTACDERAIQKGMETLKRLLESVTEEGSRLHTVHK